MGEFADKLAAQTPAFQRAYLGSLVPSLVKSGNLEKYYQILNDFDFLVAKINYPEFGVQSLIDDYDLIDRQDALNYPEYNSEKIKSLKLIQGALRLSAHILVTDKQQLASQLHGRLANRQTSEEIQTLLAQIKQGTNNPWLCPLTASLIAPGENLILTLNGHNSSVNAVAVTPNGQKVISAADDNTLKVWDLATGEELLTLKGHSSSVNAVAVTPNGQKVISACDDNTLKVWDLATGEELLTLKGHSSSVNAVAVTPNGQRVISGSSDSTLKAWNLLPRERLNFTNNHSRHISWEYPCDTLKAHSSWVNSVAVTPNGQQVISACDDNTLKVWNRFWIQEDIFEGNIFELIVASFIGSSLKADIHHSSGVNVVTITPNGQQVISASNDGTLKVWNLATGEKLFTLKGHTDTVKAIAITSNGQRVISASDDNTLKVWNLVTGKQLLTFNSHSSGLNAVAVTPSGQQVISASDDSTLKVWNLLTGEEIFTLKGHTNSVNAIAVTPNGQQVISASLDNTLKVWNLLTGEEIFTLKGHTNSVNAIAVTPNGQQVISASLDSTLKVWNLLTGKEIFTLKGHTNSVNAIAVSPNGQLVISTSDDNTLKVWNLATEEVIGTFTGESPMLCCAVAPYYMAIVAGEQSGRVHFCVLREWGTIRNW
jgi:WD40 repeat protein